MRKNYSKIRKSFLRSVSGMALGLGALNAQVTQTFTYTGAVQAFTVPSCVGSMTVELRAAGGSIGGSSGSAGAAGGSVKAVFTATPGSVMYMYVGGQGSVTAGGFNGGGNGGVSAASSGGGGGGATDIRLNGMALANRIIVAGAGGGGGGTTTYAATGGTGGGGSAFTSAVGFGGGGTGGCGLGSAGGETGGTGPNYGSGGGGGGFTSGGGSGGLGSSTGGYGCAGILGDGGAGGGTSFICGGATGGQNGGGGGGGGYYGGGGGMTGTGGCNGGGAGGSSWVNSTIFSSPSFTAGNNSGNGQIVITYLFNGPGVTISPSAPAICSGNSVTLTAGSVTSYTWLPQGSFPGSNNTTISVNPTSNTTYTVQGTNSIGCLSNALVTVTVNSGLPSLTVSSSTPSTCYGNSISVSASGALTYTFSNGISNGVLFLPTPGTNNYTINGGNGCGVTTSVVTVTISQLPVTITASSNTICAGNAATLTAAGATSYTWQPNNSTYTTTYVGPSATTVYTLVGKTGVCSGLATLTINTNPLPTMTVSVSNSLICSGDQINLSVNGNANTYSWSTGQSGTNITDAPTDVVLYTVTGVNSFNCSASASQVVVVKPLPVIVSSVSNPVACANSNATLSVSGGTTYAWTGGTTSSSSVVVVNPATSTNYSVAVTGTNGCTSNTVLSISVFAPVLNISSSPTVCIGGLATIGASAADSWVWSNGQTSQNIAVTPTMNTVYTVTASINNLNGLSCPVVASVQAYVFPVPAITANSNNSVICIGNSATLTADGAGSTGTYTWTGGSMPAFTFSNTVAPISNITYSVYGKNADGCVGMATVLQMVSPCTGIAENAGNTINLSVYPNPNNGDFTISSDQVITLHVSNELGQLVKVVNVDRNAEVKLNNLANGVYFISGKNENGSVKQKIMIAK